MSSPENSNDSKHSNPDNKLNVRIVETGLVQRERYVPSYSPIAKRVSNALDGLRTMSGKEIGTLYTGVSDGLREALEESTSASVEEQSFPFGMFLNDTAAYNDGEIAIPPVRKSEEPYIDLDDGYKAVDWESVNGDRIKRAKAKAKGRMNLYLLSEYYDKYPTADAAIIINSGSEDGIDAVKDVRGANPWASTGGSAATHVIDLNVQNELLYALYLHDKGELSLDEMTAEQLKAIDNNISKSESRKLGIQTHLNEDTNPNKRTTA